MLQWILGRYGISQNEFEMRLAKIELRRDLKVTARSNRHGEPARKKLARQLVRI